MIRALGGDAHLTSVFPMPRRGRESQCETWRWVSAPERMVLVYRIRVAQERPKFEVWWREKRGEKTAKVGVFSCVADAARYINGRVQG